jgi:hypothetical protein
MWKLCIKVWIHHPNLLVFLNSTNHLIFVTETRRVFSEVGTEFLNTI